MGDDRLDSEYDRIHCGDHTKMEWHAARDQDKPAGLTSSEQERLKELERENRELKRANEILRKAAAFFAHAELDPRLK